MNLDRRAFLQALAIASAGGLALHSSYSKAQEAANTFYEVPPFGNVHFLHFTDSHAQLLPHYYREPSTHIGVGAMKGVMPHLVDKAFLGATGLHRGTPEAHAFTALDFTEAAQTYGRMGGFAYLASLIQQIRASRPGSLLLDGGDSWQGSATALWTQAQDMVDVSLALGVDVMTAHWEMTLGEERVMQILNRDFQGKLTFLAHNIQTQDFGDAVFAPYTERIMNGVRVAIIGQAYPYTPIAHPKHFTPNWTFGIQEVHLQQMIDEVKARGAQVIVLLSHNGMDLDLKLASRVSGLHAILGGHTHDGVPIPIPVKNAGGTTLVTNAGSNGKFLGVLDFEVKSGQVIDFKYKLLPVFAHLIPEDRDLSALIRRVRDPFLTQLNEPIATTHTLLYRRGTFTGSFDQIILDALMRQKDAEIAFSPGFRWGTTVLPGTTITMEEVMNQTAITYPNTTVTMMRGEVIKTILEDVADNVFNPDPYYQQGGDMVRVGGLSYSIDPEAAMGHRISDMRLKGKLIEAHQQYKVAGWASVATPPNRSEGEPIWDLLVRDLKERKTLG